MSNQFPPDRRGAWAAVLAFAAIAVLVGVVSYNLGVSHGFAQSGAAGSASPVPPVFYYYGPRPWGFGFLGPFLFIALWILVIRALVWGGRWRRGWRYPDHFADEAARFDAWHRASHERMNAGQAPPGRTDAPGSAGA